MALALQRELSEATLRLELTPPLVVGRAGGTPTAFVIHTAHAPQEADVFWVASRARRESPELRAVSRVVPVLGGRVWSERSRTTSDRLAVWRVAPKGTRYSVVKRWLASVRKLHK